MMDQWFSYGYDARSFEFSQEFVEYLDKYKPFQSVLDVGCGFGQDLALLQIKYPGLKLTGIELDIDRAAHAGMIVYDIIQGDVNEVLPTLDRYDLVISKATLMYMDLKEILPQLRRIAKKGIVMYEQEQDIFARNLPKGIQKTKGKYDQGLWRGMGYIYDLPA